MKTMKKNFMLFLAVMILSAFVLSSCALLDSSPLIQQGSVVTTSDNISDSFTGDLVLYPRDKLPPAVSQLFPGDADLVVAPKEILKDPAKMWISTNPSDYADNAEAQNNLLWASFDTAKTFFPVLGGFELLLSVFSPRKRMHYIQAMKSLAPTDGSVDVGAAIVSVVKALGVAHTGSDTDSTVAEPPVSTPPTPSV